jgi:hypothetical protein
VSALLVVAQTLRQGEDTAASSSAVKAPAAVVAQQGRGQVADIRTAAMPDVVAPAPPSIPVPAPVQEPSPSAASSPSGNPSVLTVAEGEEAIPQYVSKPAVIHLTGIAIRRAQACHPSGHAVGTARVFVTFAPNGRVSDARLEGEPLASAPVARCILDHLRAIRMAKFNGEPFTFVRSITLR